jgi:hypothetical protein
MDKDWICKRCKHATTTKSNLLSHLRNKKPCIINRDNGGIDISFEDHIEELLHITQEPKNYSCEYCKYQFNTSQSKYRHLKTCKKNPKNTKKDNDKDLITQLQIKIEDYEKQLQAKNNGNTTNINNNTIINNTIINNITLNRNDFGAEDTSFISPDFLRYCIENPSKGMTDLIENIHYNVEHPENHNIRCKSLKQNIFEKYIDSEWRTCDASNTLDELIKKGYRLINTHFTEVIINDPAIQEDDMQQARYEIFRFLSDKSSSQYYAVKRDLRLLVRDKTQTMFVFAMPPQPLLVNAP